MVKKRKNSLILGLFLLLLLFPSVPVRAAGIDTDQLGILEVKCVYDKLPLVGVKVSLYKVAVVDARGFYNFIARYFSFTEDLNHLSSSQSRELAKKLSDYIIENEIEPDMQGEADQYGDYKFEDIETGLYLIQVDEYEKENRSYSMAPILISMPMEDPKGGYDYDVIVESKIEMVDHNPSHPTDDNTTESPSTYDEIYGYVAILVISSLLLVGAGLLYILLKKKGSNKNEKNS